MAKGENIENTILQIERSQHNEALKELNKQLWKQYYTLKLENGTAPEDLQYIYNKIKEEKEQNDVLKERYNGNLVFLTISPDEKICSLEELLELCRKITSKKWCKRYCYVIEQRGKTLEEVGKGAHAHLILFRDGHKFSDIVRECANTCKKYIHIDFKNRDKKGQFNNGAFHIVIRPHTVENNDKIKNYILGDKDNKDKQIKQQYDKVFRQNNNIQNSYHSGIDIQDLDNI